MSERLKEPDDPREWLDRARSNFILAKSKKEGVYLEDLCFDAQQAVEKAAKALLIDFGINYPYTHDLAELLTLLKRKYQLRNSGINRTNSQINSLCGSGPLPWPTGIGNRRRI